MRLIQTGKLAEWAKSKVAESRFPHIVKALICAVIQPTKLRMPSGDAVWVPGADGELVNGEENRFVPFGWSMWELGTGADYKRKANRDYRKRSEDKADDSGGGKTKRTLDRSQITFVFVTPRVWTDKEAWITERKVDGSWKDVRVIDGVDLVDWLEAAPSVNLQFADELELVPETGLYTLDQAWEEWSHRTVPPISEALVVAGRPEQETELISRLNSPPSTFIVRGDSPREAWGFTLATLRRVKADEERENLCARTIVAENEAVALRLQHLRNLIIVLKQADDQVSGLLSSRGCHVVVPEGNDARSERNVIALKRPSHGHFARALKLMGLREEETEQVTRASGRSVTVFQRLRAHANFVQPRWSQDPRLASYLVPALLAGRWNERSASDREILCRLSDVPDYSDLEGQLQELLRVDEAPLQRIAEMWTLTAPADAFQLTAWRLTGGNLERFGSSFREVFGTIDEKVEIPSTEWIYHDMKGERGHSGWLRSGMAETILLIAERGSHAGMSLQNPRAYVEKIVRGLPGLSDDWRLLASLRDEYARLMEAAPSPLLDSLERLLEARPRDVQRLFGELEVPLGSGAMHTGLLWGLETLAWRPIYLPRVGLILARLASLDPGLRMINRPINSLREIFLWWMPGTNATVSERLAAIDLILTSEEPVGWDLLAGLLPDTIPSVAHGTARPRWSDFGDLAEGARTREGGIKYMAAIHDRALDRIGTDKARWRVILNSLGGLSLSQREKTMDRIEDIAQRPLSVDVKIALWEVLRDFIYEHRTFQDANWALPVALTDRLEAILPLLAPDDPVERNRWLFDDWLPEISSRESDLERREQEIKEERLRAAREILHMKGFDGLVKLGSSCKFPGLVASVAVPLLGDIGTIHGLLAQAIAKGERGVGFAGHISANASNLHGEAWRDLILKEAKSGAWPSAVVASLLILWHDGTTTWDLAKDLGGDVEAEYWRRKPVHLIEGYGDEQIYAIERLIEAGRTAEVFDIVALRFDRVPTATLAGLFHAMFDCLAQAQTPEEMRQLRLDSHDVSEYLEEFRRREDMPRGELVRMEYLAIPFLGTLRPKGLLIQEHMAENTDFFVDVLCAAFLPAHRDKSEEIQVTPSAQARARAAYSLLEGLDLIPGQRDDDELDEEVLLQWIGSVRERAAERDRAVIADQKIGQILAHSPRDPEDDGWPHHVVRNVIEKLANDEIDRGLMMERFNLRGVYSKALYEGGDQERALANQYRDWATQARSRWPRMARVLEMIAEQWDEHGRREDERAEQRKLEFG